MILMFASPAIRSAACPSSSQSGRSRLTYGVGIVRLIESTLLDVLGPEPLHHRVELAHVKVAGVREFAAPIVVASENSIHLTRRRQRIGT